MKKCAEGNKPFKKNWGIAKNCHFRPKHDEFLFVISFIGLRSNAENSIFHLRNTVN